MRPRSHPPLKCAQEQEPVLWALPCTKGSGEKTGPTLLELLLRLEGDIRRSLEPIRAAPLQAGVLLFLRRHVEAKVTDVAAALGVRLPTMSTVVKDLVRKRWVSRRRSVKDDRVVALSFSRWGDKLALQIEQRVQQFSITLAEQDRKALSMVQKGSCDSLLRLSLQPS